MNVVMLTQLCCLKPNNIVSLGWRIRNLKKNHLLPKCSNNDTVFFSILLIGKYFFSLIRIKIKSMPLECSNVGNVVYSGWRIQKSEKKYFPDKCSNIRNIVLVQQDK